MREFEITFPGWAISLNDSPEVSQTSALIEMIVGKTIVTQNDNKWSKSIHDDAFLSAYPLALWFASCWWRLRWEPFPISMPKVTPSTEWRMSHEMMAAGHGYLWPRMLFASDGVNVHIWSIAQCSLEDKSQFRYLNSVYSAISAKNFEQTIDEFVSSVIARLSATNIEDTLLENLWEELKAERETPDLSNYRKLEALLGFDPDECPQELIKRFEDLSSEAGATAIWEIAPVCASPNPGSTLTSIISFTRSEGLEGQIDSSISRIAPRIDLTAQVWEQGQDLARQVRNILGLNGNAFTDDNLCELVGLNKTKAFSFISSPHYVPGIAIRNRSSERIKFLFKKPRRSGRRFEIARFIGDFLTTHASEQWLPVTDAKTARQKTQRAFAAEFLCPIKALCDLLADDYSEDAIDNAAEHFGVSPLAIQTQLVNNDFLPSRILGENDSGFNFPYLCNGDFY